jgi:hypothetical protein
MAPTTSTVCLILTLPGQRFNPSVPLSTPIYREEPTFDFATRLARILVKKTQMHVYVTNSLSLANAGLGGTFEEEMEAFKKVAAVASEKLQPLIKQASGTNVPNGATVA